MARGRRQGDGGGPGARDDRTEEMFDLTARMRTAPCVPALRQAVKAWRAGGYKGTTETTRRLLGHWFKTDHRLPGGARFEYHPAQREAIETLIFVWEFERVRTRKDLLERYATELRGITLPPADAFARYCVKMATGSGKTKVLSLAVAWQFLNSQREADEVAQQYARTFLLIAPNVIVLERLKTDFAGGRIFEADPVIPRDLRMFWDFDCVMRDDGERAHAEGTLFVTNIQQFYERAARKVDEEPDVMTAVLGRRPTASGDVRLDMTDFSQRIGLRDGLLMVLNDEAHHTWDEQGEWMNVIRRLHETTPVSLQLDVSATPRFQKTGSLFPWIVSDYPLKQAIIDGIVKRPMRGVADIVEARSAHASKRYEGFLVAGVERWKEYRKALAPLGRRPILFVMLTNTEEADDVGDWLRARYPDLLGGERTLVIHTNSSGEISKADLDVARRIARDVDGEDSEVSALVSVLMLREGWDVQNVTVVVGLRPFTAKANVLPEQAIGRGLRLMFRGAAGHGYKERVDIIGNSTFLEFVDDLEKLEDLQIPVFDIGKDKVRILTICPEAGRAAYDLGLPVLTPALVRKRSLAEEIGALDLASMKLPELPVRSDDAAAKTFRYEGFDVITLIREVEREYSIPEPQTAQEVIGYYARRIAEQLKLPASFAALAGKLREFFAERAFGRRVDLGEPGIVKAMSTPVAAYLTVNEFRKALSSVAVAELEPRLLEPDRMLSTCSPFPWSEQVLAATKTAFNLVACESSFELAFARFVDGAKDVAAFAKLPMQFGFYIEYLDPERNLRLYYPDWVVRDSEGGSWLIETKGLVTPEVPMKDDAAVRWCEAAASLGGRRWRYLRVNEKEFAALGARHLVDLLGLWRA